MLVITCTVTVENVEWGYSALLLCRLLCGASECAGRTEQAAVPEDWS